MSPIPGHKEPATDDQPDPSLHTEVIGHGPRVVLAHGFTQTGHLWNTVEERLATDNQVVRVDMPGHAGSSHVAADLIEGAHLLGAAGGEAAYVGYSMGARFCLHLALARPELVTTLVLISGTAGMERPADRAARTGERRGAGLRARPARPPRRLRRPALGAPGPAGRLPPAVARQPALRRRAPEATGFEERRRNTGPGLASSLRLAGTGTQLPLWDRLDRLEMPVLVITGAYDDRFTEIGRRLTAAIGGNATHVVVPATGHSPQLQRPSWWRR